jgi:uncharacterized membrane protein
MVWIEVCVDASTVNWHCVVASPNRSASVSQLRAFIVFFGLVCGVVCAFSFAQGNVLAPLFGLLDVLFVAWALRLAWRAADQSDRVVWEGGDVRVEMRRGARVAQASFHPYWVKLKRLPAARDSDPERVLIGSHGRFVEVGRFLSAERRQKFAEDVAALLASARQA